jgi:hypothetical protein
MVNVNSEKRTLIRAWREFDDKTSEMEDVCDLERFKIQSLTLSPYLSIKMDLKSKNLPKLQF